MAATKAAQNKKAISQAYMQWRQACCKRDIALGKAANYTPWRPFHPEHAQTIEALLRHLGEAEDNVREADKLLGIALGEE